MVNTNWGQGPVNTNLRPRPGAEVGGKRQGQRPSKRSGAGKYKHPIINTEKVEFIARLW